jgi:hypothetical protein
VVPVVLSYLTVSFLFFEFVFRVAHQIPVDHVHLPNFGRLWTGIATLDKELMYGLVPELKKDRGRYPTIHIGTTVLPIWVFWVHVDSQTLFFWLTVYNFQQKTVHVAAEIVGIMGKTKFIDVTGDDIMRRISAEQVRTLSELFPEVPSGCLLEGTAPPRLQETWKARPSIY